jgi:hypothetical protein
MVWARSEHLHVIDLRKAVRQHREGQGISSINPNEFVSPSLVPACARKACPDDRNSGYTGSGRNGAKLRQFSVVPKGGIPISERVV